MVSKQPTFLYFPIPERFQPESSFCGLWVGIHRQSNSSSSLVRSNVYFHLARPWSLPSSPHSGNERHIFKIFCTICAWITVCPGLIITLLLVVNGNCFLESITAVKPCNSFQTCTGAVQKRFKYKFAWKSSGTLDAAMRSLWASSIKERPFARPASGSGSNLKARLLVWQSVGVYVKFLFLILQLKDQRSNHTFKMSRHIITRRLSVKRKYTDDISDQTQISESQLNKVM